MAKATFSKNNPILDDTKKRLHFHRNYLKASIGLNIILFVILLFKFNY